MVKYINLTPHTLNIFSKSGVETIVPCTEVSPRRFLCLRCKAASKVISELADEIEVVQTSFGKLEIGTVNIAGIDFIPDSSLVIPNGDIYIVSYACLKVIERMDFDECVKFQPNLMKISSQFVAPGISIINDNGDYIGCKGLSKL